MKAKIRLKISAAIMALILFCPGIYSLPLTRTLYIAESDTIDLAVSSDYIFTSRQIVVEKFSAGTGLWSGASVSASFDALGSGIIGFDSAGDSFIDFMNYLDTFSSGPFRMAYSCSLRFPTGPDAYRFEKYRNAAFGNNEIKTGAVMSLQPADNGMIFMNLFYTFRQGEGEGFYGGFMLNPAEGPAWKSFFGLNPFCGKAFLHYRRLANDYVSFSAAGMYSGFFPFVIFAEVYYSVKVYNDPEYLEEIPIEGDRINPLLLSSGIKFCIKDSFIMQGYGLINPFQTEGYIKWQAGLLFNLIF